MEVVISKPVESHIAAIAAICSAGWKQTVEGKLSAEYQAANIDFWYSRQRIRNDIENGFYTHVALLGTTVAGVIGGGMTALDTGEVFVLYVDESRRYHGIGRQLLEALTRLQIGQGATEQWVSVQDGNQYGIPFYQARGFSYQGRQTAMTDTGEVQVSLRYSRKIPHL